MMKAASETPMAQRSRQEKAVDRRYRAFLPDANPRGPTRTDGVRITFETQQQGPRESVSPAGYFHGSGELP